MKKILTASQIRLADTYTIQHAPITSIDLMERAAKAATTAILKRFNHCTCYDVYCGKGNNGGDGLAIARMLSQNDKFEINLYIINNSNKASEDFNVNFERLKECTNTKIHYINNENDLETPLSKTIIIDALLGTGLNKTVSGFFSQTITHINSLENTTVSIDIPSGLFADVSEVSYSLQTVVKATITYSFQFYKQTFLYAETGFFTGIVEVLPIGIILPDTDEFKTQNFLIEPFDCKDFLPPRQQFSHKGNYGHALLFAGSKGKSGAAILAAKACLRSGAGLLTVHSIASVSNAINICLPSAMTSIDNNKNMISELHLHANYTSIAIGPGIGNDALTSTVLKQLIQQTKVPLIIDADAINILAENKTWLSFLPSGCILTPHPKEFERLVGKWNNSMERNNLLRDFCSKYNCYVILKGSYTCICTPLGLFYFNTSGNPGMAKGGSGDVLTGILAGLYAQGLAAYRVCLLGVYLHGLAGDLTKKKWGEIAMLPEDLIDQLGIALEQIKMG